MDALTRDRFPVDDGVELWAADTDADGRSTLEGWAVTYRDTPNFSGRILVPGAFRESLKRRPTKAKPLPMGYEHSTFGGTNPIGGWHGFEDNPDQGLLLKDGRISDTTTGRDVETLIRDRALNGLSIGFRADERSVVWGKPGETHDFKTPYGKRSYDVDEDGDGVMFVTKAELLETSVVSTPADDDARLTKIQSLTAQVAQALPGLGEEPSWDELAYSMALLMGGRGAGAFSDLPELERIALYQRLAAGYRREGRTPPPYDPDPDFRAVPFEHDERRIFSQSFAAKRLADARAGIRTFEGPLSREGCAMLFAIARDVIPQRLGPLTQQQRQTITELVDALNAHLADDPMTDLLADLRDTNDLLRR